MTLDQAPNQRATLAVVQNEVEHAREDIKQLRGDVLGVLEKHDDRIRALERQSPLRSVAEAITGIVAVVAVALGIVKQP